MINVGTRSTRFAGPRPARGMSLVEVSIALLVTAVATAACMQAATAAAKTAQTAENVRQATALTDTMMNYLVMLPFADPTTPSAALGADSGESATSPLAWTTWDDAHGWSGLPIEQSAASGWSMQVTVGFVTMGDPLVGSGTDQGLKRITITTLRFGRPLLTRTMLVTRE